jgi:hypothetical protein
MNNDSFETWLRDLETWLNANKVSPRQTRETHAQETYTPKGVSPARVCLSRVRLRPWDLVRLTPRAQILFNLRN